MTGESIVEEGAQPLALEVISNYLTSMISRIQSAAFDNTYGASAEHYRKQLRRVRAVISQKLNLQRQSLEVSMRMAERISIYQKLAISSMPKTIQDSVTVSTSYGAY